MCVRARTCVYVRVVVAAKVTFLVIPTWFQPANKLNAKFKYLKSDISGTWRERASERASELVSRSAVTLNAIFPVTQTGTRDKTLPTSLTITAELIVLPLITSIVINYYYRVQFESAALAARWLSANY